LNAIARPTVLPAPAARRARPTFAGAVRSELLKIGRQTLTWVLLGGIVLITAIALGALAASGGARQTLDHDPLSFYFTYLAATQGVFTTASGIFLLITGSRLVAMEYGSGTIRIVLARGTGRLGLLAAQYTALAIAGLLLFAGFAIATGGFLYVLVTAWHGSFAPITSLPQAAWADTWRSVLVAATSMAVCILLAVAAAVLGRSVAFGVGVAMGLFPADNFGVIVMLLMGRVTHQDFWLKLTQWFLGPNLNVLARTIETDHRVPTAFAPPLVPVGATHVWAVIGVYAAVFLAAALALTWRRDVLH